MPATTTVFLSLTVEISSAKFLTEELTWAIFRIFRFVIIPCISVLGILGNVTSIVILTRQGFRKCSNILLLSLAVSDVLLLIGANNVPYFIYTFIYLGGFSGSIFSICFILYLIFDCAYIVGMLSATLIPVLITGERMLSILCPLTAHLFLTPRRTAVVVSYVFFVSAAYCLYHEMLCQQLQNDVLQNKTVGISLHADMFTNHIGSELYQKITRIANFVTGIISISLVTAGCVVIGLKVVHITKRRHLMISHRATATTKHGMTKTTRTLMKICLLYTVCYGWAFSLIYALEVTLLEEGLHIMSVMFCVQDMLLCLNCVGDFLIYLNSTKSFRQTKIVG
ncbi:unnamed protein product [Candidula unifasciata]|uniref:G-protein coupled receptors family 1 profile domain-containing protein n=1 Tax=Candidula unifasciata TaxID=100452 RepID=A0A8S3ZEK8_9EUPU|nr:unnamed protein product [Candidula unifasciata]